MNRENRYFDKSEFVANGESLSVTQYAASILDNIYCISILKKCISTVYSIYLRLTLFNLVIFFLKYVPTGIYMYKFLKNVYITSRERLQQKQMELEDIQLQIQIVNTKLCVRDAEFNERAELLRREAERLRRVRTRVRDVISGDEVLRSAIVNAAECDSNLDMHMQNATDDDNNLIMELLKGIKRDQIGRSESNHEKLDCGEHAENASAAEHSLYSSLSDMDIHQNCRVKIVKITNVYKVAYLRHYIKQKRLRRANKRAVLKKKMESIKKLLEDWQKSLDMVINSKLTILNMESHPIDMASQEAMGDYSKPREASDSDSDLRNNDLFYDDYNVNWPQSLGRPCVYNYEDVSDAPVGKENMYDPQDNGDVKYCQHVPSEYIGPKASKMSSILEETGSQMAIEEVIDEGGDDGNCRDLISI